MATRKDKVQIVVGAKDKTGKVLSGIKSQLLAVGSAYAAFAAGKAIIGDSIAAAANYEATITSLESVVSTTGRNINEVYAEMETQLGGLAGKAQIAEGFLKGMTTELSVQQVSQLTTSIKDASVAMGEDFNVQLPLIIKAIKQLNPAILDNIGVTVRLDEVNKKIRDGFYGAGTAITEYTQQNAIFQEVVKQTAKFQGQEEQLLKTTKGAWGLLVGELEGAQLVIGNLLIGGDALAGSISAVTSVVKGATSLVQLFTSKSIDMADAVSDSELDKGMQLIADHFRELGQARPAVNTMEDYVRLLKDIKNQQLGETMKELSVGLASLRLGFEHATDATDTYGSSYESMSERQKKALEQIDKMQRWADKRAVVSRLDMTDSFVQFDQQIVGSRKASTLEELELTIEAGNNQIGILTDLQDRKRDLIEQGLTEEEAARMVGFELEEQFQIEQNDKLINLAYQKTALELGITTAALDERLAKERETYKKIERYINGYLKRVGGDMRSFIHQVVADTDRGVNSMGEIWNELGKSVRSVIIDMMLDALFQWVGNILSKLLPTMVTEGVAVKLLTRQYTLLAAAKAAANPFSAPGRIAAAGSVMGSLSASSLLGFDDPINDEIAMKHGRDYAKFFMRGARDSFGSPRFGLDVTQAIGQATTVPTGAGGGLTINFNAPVTDEEFVQQTIVPIIEQAAIDGGSRLLIDADTMTGEASVNIG